MLTPLYIKMLLVWGKINKHSRCLWSVLSFLHNYFIYSISLFFKCVFLSPAMPSISVVFLSGWRGFGDRLSHSIYHIKYQPSGPLLFCLTLSSLVPPAFLCRSPSLSVSLQMAYACSFTLEPSHFFMQYLWSLGVKFNELK